MTRSKDGLTRSELRTWKRLTSATAALFQALDQELRSDTGVSLDDFAVLRPLWAAPETPLRMSELADQLSFSPSRLSHAIKRMEEKGWVRRESSSDDGRVRLVRLTPAGLDVFHRAWPGHAQMIRALFLDQLDDHEREVLERGFSKIRRAARDRGDRT